ncbi:MAG: protein kinase [Acidobacteria bacterium]|nr:protein kinase [Acidobacteriota bacterium]
MPRFRMLGQTVSHYRVLEKLGAGGMGVVYRAEDIRLGRPVALKFLSSTATPRNRLRLRREAEAASRLDHPNICTVYEVDTTENGDAFIAMAYYAGETLEQKMRRTRMPAEEAVAIAIQMARGLAKAHSQGIVHRDLKPANVVITDDGVAKILDFGIAKLADGVTRTRSGGSMGTIGYVSPEQVNGGDVDARTDVWSLGVILYEMLAGEPAFPGSTVATLHAIAYAETTPLAQIRTDLPRPLIALIERAMRKDPAGRHASMNDLLTDLIAAQSAPSPRSLAAAKQRWPVRTVITAMLGALLVLFAIAWSLHQSSRASHARAQMLPEIERLGTARQYAAAYRLAQAAEGIIPTDPALQQLWQEISTPVTVETTPAGALVEMRPYGATSEGWQVLGVTPISKRRIPLGYTRFRITKEGWETLDRAAPARAGILDFELPLRGTTPAGMVLVEGGTHVYYVGSLGHVPPMVRLERFFIDRYEVTNREYKRFVDAGGYRNRAFWKHGFRNDGRPLSWHEAMALFRDRTGRPGPSTWELGEYPAGQDAFPVTGVSWFEAAAYAEYAGKQLPSIYHWLAAAGINNMGPMMQLANFSSSGLVRVGSLQAVSPFGADDMAGNAKEWCLNASDDARYSLGGGVGEPRHVAGLPDARSPFDRSPTNGFRCARYTSDIAADPAVLAPVRRLGRDYGLEHPVADGVFEAYARLYATDPTPLDAEVERFAGESPYWTVEKFTFNAAYGDERVSAYLLLPKKGTPPFQTVVFFPGAYALQNAPSGTFADQAAYDFIVGSGRAVLYPVYKGTYERSAGQPLTASVLRDLRIAWVKDLSRALDYLETRRHVDMRGLSYFGTSLGASFGPIPLALEPRLKVGILIGGGLPLGAEAPEVDPVNFVPRVKLPILMLNGRYDFLFPLNDSQIPFFSLLGTPASAKRRLVVEAPHLVPRHELVRPVLDWLDGHFGTPQEQ